MSHGIPNGIGIAKLVSLEWSWLDGKTFLFDNSFASLDYILILDSGMGMGMNHWEWEGMGLKKSISAHL